MCGGGGGGWGGGVSWECVRAGGRGGEPEWHSNRSRAAVLASTSPHQPPALTPTVAQKYDSLDSFSCTSYENIL